MTLRSVWPVLGLLLLVLWPVQGMAQKDLAQKDLAQKDLAQNPAAPFSIRCEIDGTAYFLTFDGETRRVITEHPSMTKGRILSVRGGDIRFAQAPSVRLPRLELIYRRDAGVIDLVGYGAASSVFVNCVPAELRPVLSRYDAIWPPDGDWQDEQGWARSVLAMLDNAFIHPVLFVLIMLVVWIRWVPVVRRAIRTGRLRVRGLLARGPLGWRVFDRERDPKRYWGLLIPVLVVNGVIPMLIVLAMLLGIPPFKIWS